MAEESPHERNLRLVLTKATPVKKPSKPRASKAATLRIVGNGNVVGDGNTVLHPERVVTVTKAVPRDPNVDYITEAQCADLLARIDGWYALRSELRKSETKIQALKKAMNNHVKVATYRNMDQAQYAKAVAFIQQQMIILRKMPSAAKKLPLETRSSFITAIQTRCKQFADGEEKRKAYMQKHFGVDSMKNMDLAQLKQLHGYVFGWKLPQR